MTYTLEHLAELNGGRLEVLQRCFDFMFLCGWVTVVGITEQGSWIYEPTPRLMGKVGRN